MENLSQGRIDLQEIERRAHQLRAEAARDGVKALGTWLRARFTRAGVPVASTR